MLRPGDPVPDVMLLGPSGERTSLRSFAGEATALIFLRHLGWLPCRGHLVEMSQHRHLLAGRLACVTFAAPTALDAFARELEIDIPLYADPDRAAYAAFGFERGSLRRVWLHPRVWARYAQLLARGHRPGLSGQDTLQLGGDVVLDAHGRMRWIHRSAGPDDRPPVADVADALRRAARG